MKKIKDYFTNKKGKWIAALLIVFVIAAGVYFERSHIIKIDIKEAISEKVASSNDNNDKFFEKVSIKIIIITLGIVSLLVIIITILYIIKMAADRDIFVTNVREGTGKPIMGAGNKFIKFLWQYDGYRLLTSIDKAQAYNKKNGTKKDIWDIVPLTQDEKAESINSGNFLSDKLGLGGIQFYGIPGLHKIYDYRFRWNSLRQNPGKNTEESGGGIYFEPHDYILRYVLFQSDIYYAKLEKAEDRRMLQLDVDFTIAVRVRNPYKALFRVQEWLEYTWGQILPAVRRTIRHYYDWIDEIKFNESGEAVIEDSDEEAKEKADRMGRIIWEKLNEIKYTDGQGDPTTDGAKSIIEKLFEYYGVQIDDFTMLRIDVAGDKKGEFVEIATKVIKSLQNARAKRIDFNVEVERLQAVYGKIQGLGDIGALVRRLEAYEKSSEHGTVLVSAPELTKAAESVGNIMKLGNIMK